MNEPRKYLPRDLKAMRYLDALNAGDLEAVSTLWEEASHDPELERVLAELDGAMLQEVLGNRRELTDQFGRRRRWGVRIFAAVALAAACLLAVLAWPRRDAKNPVPSSPGGPTVDQVALRPSDVAHDVTPLREARRKLDEAELPPYVWPLENRLSASTPLDLLD
ncbi:MAG TPA: hypothetical protein VKA15_18015 [Isosphaeraceae bacterium]|nr:hypothetical protein [Isosphaeraceae bacterium]